MTPKLRTNHVFYGVPFFFSSRRRHTCFDCDWSSDVCSSDLVTQHMTVRDLLTHRSGLSLGEGDLLIVPDTNRSRADIVHALRFLKPATGFRENFAYDNILYRSEERRVGKEWRPLWAMEQLRV